MIRDDGIQILSTSRCLWLIKAAWLAVFDLYIVQDCNFVADIVL